MESGNPTDVIIMTEEKYAALGVENAVAALNKALCKARALGLKVEMESVGSKAFACDCTISEAFSVRIYRRVSLHNGGTP